LGFLPLVSFLSILFHYYRHQKLYPDVLQSALPHILGYIIIIMKAQLSVIAIAFLATCLAEAISYLLLYRTEKYKSLVRVLDRYTKKQDKQKEQQESSLHSKSQQKKWNREEEQLRKLGKEFTTMQFRSTLAVGVLMMFVFAMMNRFFRGLVVARLPFVPIWPLKGLAHRGLTNPNVTDASASLIYVLSSLVFRQTTQRMLGHAVKLPAAARDWMTPNK
jgi:calcium load-activated calcium channel